MRRLIAILGEYRPSYQPHQATDAAIEHSTRFLDADIGVKWISTQAIDERRMDDYSGLWIAPGSLLVEMDVAAGYDHEPPVVVPTVSNHIASFLDDRHPWPCS
ncbi:MAG: hypothetical protein JSR31_01545 [Nitrospira sp.]|nr:hypothetical protein [Nitrospira sp.]